MRGRSVITATGPSRSLVDGAAGQARVSIGVPVFNGARYLEDCLESLITQTYGDVEILISDNASTDETPAICRAYCERDDRVRYHRHPENIGASANFNFLVGNTRGELFKWAAHDDVCAPDLVARCVAALDASPAAVLAFARTGFIDDSGDQLHGYDVPIRWSNHDTSFARLREQLDIPQGALHHMCTRQFGVIRRDQLLRTSLIRNHVGSDLVMMLELALLGGLVSVEDHPDCLLFVRLHDDSSMGANRPAAELGRWMDPRSGGKYPLKWTRVLTGYVRAVVNSSLSRREKVAGMLLIARWLVSDDNWRIIGGELKRRLPRLVPVHNLSWAGRRQ
jgi:glycosyltransferase involved in cell wall biosynthesis